jgi:beta-galactosidase
MANIQITEAIQLSRKISPVNRVSGLCTTHLILRKLIFLLSHILFFVTSINDTELILFREFYTGWLTHWGESIATTDARSTAKALKDILCRNGSAVLYVCHWNLFISVFHLQLGSTYFFSHEICFQMAHGGTNFGFYNGANTGQDESEYKADLTSYDYVSIFPNKTYHFLNHFCTCTYLCDVLHQDAPIKEHGDVQNPKYKGMLYYI